MKAVVRAGRTISTLCPCHRRKNTRVISCPRFTGLCTRFSEGVYIAALGSEICFGTEGLDDTGTRSQQRSRFRKLPEHQSCTLWLLDATDMLRIEIANL
jgi:hypothetical protein